MELSLLISSIIHRYDIEPLEPGKKVSALSVQVEQGADLAISPACYRRRILEKATGVQCSHEAQGYLGVKCRLMLMIPHHVLVNAVIGTCDDTYAPYQIMISD
jgi:hypothetical protein